MILADHTAKQYTINMIGCWHYNVVSLSACNAVHCGVRGRCKGLKVAPSSVVFLAGNFLFTSQRRLL